MWLGFAAGELLTLLILGILIRARSGERPWKYGTCLLLKEGFGAEENGTLEMDISGITDTVAASRRAEQFCLENGQDARTASHIALCIEEMAGNVIRYGFQDGKAHHLSILLLNKPDYWVLRFRDDCRAFDPVHYVPQENEQPIGIRLVMALAGEARYTCSMNLNNLTLKIQKQRKCS